MNEAILENYLDVIQGCDDPYLTEGLRDFAGKFSKQSLKRTFDKLHMAFSKGDGQSFEDVAKQSAVKLKKMPKAAEVEEYTKNLIEDNPEFGRAVGLSKKVLKNTYKIRDKNKLAIIGNLVGAASWIKSKGGKYDIMKTTKTTLQEIGSQVSSVYDTGFDDMETSSPEEEEMKRKMIEQSKKQEKVEMIIVLVILGVLAAAAVWAGMGIWAVATNPWLHYLAIATTLGVILFKILCGLVGLAALLVIPITTYIKVKGG